MDKPSISMSDENGLSITLGNSFDAKELLKLLVLNWLLKINPSKMEENSNEKISKSAPEIENLRFFSFR